MKRIFKRNIYLLFGLTALCSGIIGCDDRIDDSVSPVSGQELVTVPLSFGFAEESFGELYRNGSRFYRLQREPVARCDNACFD